MNNYIGVTEFPGEKVPREQFERLCHRYYWASFFCKGKDVVEVACGSGFGAYFLSLHSKSFTAGDYSREMVEIAIKNTQHRINISQYDATQMPYENNSKDVIIICEAIYYLPDVQLFFEECKRVLRLSGKLLIVSANKDLVDFNPSPFSHKYLGVSELSNLLDNLNWRSQFFGYVDITKSSLRQEIFRPIKQLAVKLNLIPKTMDGKRFLKRLVFGKMVDVPRELSDGMMQYKRPTEIIKNSPDRVHKVIYCLAEPNHNHK